MAYLPYQVALVTELPILVMAGDWCEQQWPDEMGDTWYLSLINHLGQRKYAMNFNFQREEDAVMFRLVWCK